MRTACSVLVVVMLVFALGACGESDEEKAQNTGCDAKADIGEQVDELKAVTPATVTGDDVTQNLDAIKTDLKNIEAAQGDLSSDRRSPDDGRRNRTMRPDGQFQEVRYLAQFHASRADRGTDQPEGDDRSVGSLD